MKNRIRLWETLNGRTTLMVAFFLLILIGFSTFVFVRNNSLRKDYDLFANYYHRTELTYFVNNFLLCAAQAQILEAIYYKNPEKQNTIHKSLDKVKDLIIYDLRNRAVDTLGLTNIESNLNNVIPAIDELKVTTDNIYEKIKERNQYTTKAKQDSMDLVLMSLYKEDVGKSIGKYYQNMGPAFGTISSTSLKFRIELGERLVNGTKVIFTISIVFSIIFIIVWYYFRNKLNESIKTPRTLIGQLAQGKLLDTANVGKDELGSIIEASNSLAVNLKSASEFALEIGKGNYDHEFQPIGKDDILGNALIQMRGNLKEYAAKEKIQNWSNVGQAKFAEILRNNDRTVEDISFDLISNLVKYLEANQGALFLHDDATNSLNMVACYAYERRKFVDKTVEEGDGLVWQCYVEGDSIFLTEIPEGYVKITSGLGESTPASILIVPIRTDDKIEGVIEIASFEILEDYKKQFAEKVGQNIASVVGNIKQNELTKKLLAETRSTSENMRSQEEELRQNLEELHATQEEMRRRENEYIAKIKELETKLALR